MIRGGRPPSPARAVALSAALLYVAAAACFPWSKPGLQYDEALVVRDAVQMLHHGSAPTFTHEVSSWVYVGRMGFPVMDLPYLGPIKAYLSIVPFAIFGSGAAVCRGIGVALTAAGIGMLALALSRAISPGVGAAVGVLLAVHPALLDQTIYDNNIVSVWMLTLGLVLLALVRFVQAPFNLEAFLLGLACGLAVWGRLNFTWLLAAAAVSAALCVSGVWRVARDRWASAAFGFGWACTPVFLYEALTRGGTVTFMQAGHPRQAWPGRALARLPFLAETLLSDGEHRAIWNGPAVPRWEVAFTAALAVTGVILALALPRASRETRGDAAWRRGAALTAILFTMVMTGSGLNVTEHHMVTVVPMAAIAAVLGIRRLAAGSGAARGAFALAGGVLLFLFASWNLRSIRGLKATGGVGSWSDAIEDVTAALRTRAKDQAVGALTWGLANNAFVLSRGSVRMDELFVTATPTTAPDRRPWRDVIRGGGFFLIGALPSAAKTGFRNALPTSGVAFRKWTFRERGGALYAELFQVFPAEPPTAAGRGSGR